MMPGDLHAQRLAAALASRGVSTGPIYHLVIRLCRELGLRGDLLEFGAGTGNLIGLLAGLPYDGRIVGADLLPRPADLPAAVGWVEADLNAPTPLAAAAFDVLVSTEVIEHLENPRATFREWFRLLRPGGTLLATTPNQESLRSLLSLLLRGHHVAFLDGSYPAHLTALLRLDLQRLCREAGFGAPGFHYTDSGDVPRLSPRRWQDLSAGRLRGRLFSDNLALVARKP